VENPLVFGIVLVIFGLLLGGLIAWLILKLNMQGQYLALKKVEENYVLKKIHEALQAQADILKDDLFEKTEEVQSLSARCAAQDEQIRHLKSQFDAQKVQLEELQRQARVEFENISNRLLHENSKTFTEQNSKQLNDILTPLREKIRDFEENIEKRYINELKERTSLKKEIEDLKTLNVQLSENANNLASALKGDNKTQGDWGEIQLEVLLERSGLQKGTHFEAQSSFSDQDGKAKRPDFVINLPEGKHLIIDSKVSLKSYLAYNKETDSKLQSAHLKHHIDSLKRHIADLKSKNYAQLYQINTPDYVLMFVPLESALGLALQSDQNIFLKALDDNIIIVTTSTLLATMRTVSYIWRQENQKHHVLEIARQSGLLYDKFCLFVDDLQAIGQRLGQANAAYDNAMNKLTDSKKFGDTLIGRAEKIKSLGAKANKQLPKALIHKAIESNQNLNSGDEES